MAAGHPYVLAVCGGIGSGKSVVRDLLGLLLSCPTYDSDTRAKELYFDPHIRKSVATLLGADPVCEDGTLDKVRLRQAIADDETRVLLERIIHTAVIHDFEQFCHASARTVVVVESAILFTSGMYRLADVIMAVDSSDDLRSERVGQRDGEGQFTSFDRLQTEEALLRQSHATYWVDNSGETSLILQCEEIISQLSSNL